MTLDQYLTRYRLLQRTLEQDERMAELIDQSAYAAFLRRFAKSNSPALAPYLLTRELMAERIEKRGRLCVRYAERLALLNEKAKPFGVQVAHENVVHYVGEDPAFMREMQTRLGRDFAMVLDLKQAYRAGADPFAFIDAVGESIVHVHASDSDPDHDCLPPGKGAFPFRRLFDVLEGRGYRGKYIIELYRHNFCDEGDLAAAQRFLRQTLGED